jgi:mannose-6-phosphate isomerase-like protein (cupin superfamily)
MTYPPALYTGDTGEVSARFRPHDTEPDLTYPSGTRVEYLATGESTDAKFGLYRWNMTGTPGGAGLHFHRSLSESFFVLSGTVRLYDGAREVDAVPGDYLYVPEGGIHGFDNVSGEPASMLILFSPGAPREGYFDGLLKLRTGLTMTDEERDAFYVAHDNIFVPEA